MVRREVGEVWLMAHRGPEYGFTMKDMKGMKGLKDETFQAGFYLMDVANY